MGDKEMTKREKFIEFVEHMMTQMNFSASELEEHKEAIDFFASLKATTAEQEKPLFTEKGKIIFQFMKDNKETYNNMFKAKDIGEKLAISSRGAAATIRKLITDGYVEKFGDEPVVYSLTTLGENFSFNE